jgi:tetratricopeptide (TPR) repeat protein
MSNILEMIGVGLDKSLIRLLLPQYDCLDPVEEEHLIKQAGVKPFETECRFRLGVHYALLGAMEPAQTHFDEILALNPNHIETSLAGASMLAAAGELDESIERFQHLKRIAPQNARVDFGLGYCYERSGKQDKALAHYEFAQQVMPTLDIATKRIAAIKLHRGDVPAAIEQYIQLIKANPGAVWTYLMLGQMQLHVGSHAEAVETFERALTIEPDNFDMHDDYVESLMQSGCYEEAIEELHHKIEQEGEFPDTYVRLADMYAQVQNDEAAMLNYDKALEIHPSYIEAIVKSGTQHLRMERFLDAAAMFNAAVELNDQLVTAYMGLGIAQLYSGKSTVAADTLDLAQALEPNTNLLFSEVARLQLKISLAQKPQYETQAVSGGGGEREHERDNLLCLQMERHRQAIMQNPNHADLHYRYALLLRSRGKYPEAIKHYKIALEINPSFHKAGVKLGLCQRESGDHSEGLEQLKKSVEINPEFIDLHYKLGLMYCDPIQFALAVEHYTLESETSKQGNVHDNLELALQNMGLVDRCMATWQAVCELDPQSKMAFLSHRSLKSLKSVR